MIGLEYEYSFVGRVPSAKDGPHEECGRPEEKIKVSQEAMGLLNLFCQTIPTLLKWNHDLKGELRIDTPDVTETLGMGRLKVKCNLLRSMQGARDGQTIPAYQRYGTRTD